MAKKKGSLSAIYMQTEADSTSVSGGALSRVGTTLWYMVASSTNFYWDKAKAITVYDGASPVVPLEIDYAAGAVRLSAAASGSVTADFYKFACSQVGGFRSFSIDESMELVECGCFEDEGEVYEPGMYSCTGSGDGFWSSVDATLDCNGLTFYSKVLGSAGNDIAIECVVSGNNTELSVSVSSTVITITSATNGSGDATSTLEAIKQAVDAYPAAAALVKCKYTTGHTGLEVMGAISHTHLAGGLFTDIISAGAYDSFTTSKGSDKDLTFRAVTIGDQSANPITVTCVVSGSETALSVSVSDTDITINSATNAGGDATSTASQIREAVNGHAQAKLLVVVTNALNETGTGVFGALDQSTLTGGYSISSALSWAEDLIGVFYWDSGASLIRTSGLIMLEKISFKTGVKGLVGKSMGWRSQGMMYDHAG